MAVEINENTLLCGSEDIDLEVSIGETEYVFMEIIPERYMMEVVSLGSIDEKRYPLNI
jgi:hypothetical protein